VGTGIFSRRVKWLGCESDHLPPPNARVRDRRTRTATLRTTSWRVANLLLIIAVSQGILFVYVCVFASSAGAEFLSVVASLAASGRAQEPISPLTSNTRAIDWAM
jgi:hypothetical protein